VSAPTFSINRSDVIRNQVQQAIRPETVALSAFGAIAAFAMLVLVAQGLAQMVGRSAPDIAVFRALGATRGQAALAVLAARSVRPREIGAGVGSSAVARAAAAAGLPAAAVVGTRNAFEPGTGMRAVPVRSALLGSIAAGAAANSPCSRRSV